MDISKYIKLCNSFVMLMHPLLEIVIHDLSSGKICYINGGLSNRAVGDDSLIDLDEIKHLKDTDNLHHTSYTKLNFDGKLIKSISIFIDDNYLICMNFDISIFNQMQIISNTLIEKNHTVSNSPEYLFKYDWQERLHVIIHEFLSEKSWDFNALKSTQKKEVISYLFVLGIFNEKKAADYIAKVLNMGRATIFNYLRELRKNENI